MFAACAPPLPRPNAARTGARDLCVPPAEPCAPLGAGQRVSSAPFGSLRLAVVSPFCAPAACVVDRVRVGRAVRLVRSAVSLFCADCKGYPPSYGAFGALWSVPPSHPEGLSGERARAKNACAVLAVVQQRTRVGSAP